MSTEIISGELGLRLDDYLSRMTPFGFSGAMLLAKDGQIVLNKGYGLANRAKGLPNTAQTVFSTGSISKQFTAAAIMKLEMLGKLHTSDPLPKFFPGVPADKANITLHQLLTHTAGIINYSGEDFVMADKEETVLKILAAPLRFEPGTEYAYSNAGYSLLAAIVEQAGQRPYEQFLHEQLLAPAGLQHTGYRLPDWSKMNVAHWYNGRSDFGTTLDKPYPSWNLLGNGGILSTTLDMFCWHQALLGDEILSDAAKQKLYTPDFHDYAYGWRVVETEYGRCLQHNGASSFGSSALFRRYIDANVVLVLFCNQDYNGEVLINAVQDQIEAVIFGEEIPLPPAVPTPPPFSLEEFVGDLVLPDGSIVHVSVENDALHLTPGSQAGVNWLLGLSKAETAVYNQTFRQTQTIMAAALAGNTEPLLASLARREARTPGVLRTWQEVVDEVQPTEMMVLGIRPSLYLPDAYEALIKFTGPEENICFVSIWRDGQNVGVILTELVNDNIFTAVAQPITANTLVTYHLTYTQPRQFQIRIDGDKIRGIISGQNISAQKA
ncbi:MAG: beta-lactamase family protein [Anaerolineales bacterium]|nr:beta-lactamase family protein [Anaerolineales bacterium]